jgi:hypothetical protein
MPSAHLTVARDVPVNDRNGLRQSPCTVYREHIRRNFDREINWLGQYSTNTLDFLHPACAPFERMNPATRFFGVELEVERRKKTPTNILHQIYTSMPEFVLCKPDGSLSNGFEIVTAPATLEAHRMMWKNFLRERGDLTKKKPGAWLRGYASPRCGMHVHVNRASLTPMVTARLWKFINDSKLDVYLSRIAGRKMSPLGHIVGRGGSRISNYYVTHPNKTFRQVFFEPSNIGRHSAINLQNQATIEIRIFRSNTDLVGMLKNLDFVDAACTFCEETPSSFINGVNFIEWVTSTRVSPRYPYLMRWMKYHRVWLLAEATKKAA